MAYVTRVAKCDICGKIKGDANKWFVFDDYSYDPGSDNSQFAMWHWEFGNIQNAEGVKFACSEQCLFKAQQPFLSRRSQP